MENTNTVELATKHKTRKEDVDFPYEAKKLFGLLDKDEKEEEDE